MNLIRWDPFRELEAIQNRLNRLFTESPARGDEGVAFFSDWAPAVDIQETDKEYLVKADLPDVNKENVKVELTDGMLVIQGERKTEKDEKGKKFHRVERAYGKFVRRFSLPTEVDTTGVAAEFKDGVLNVHLPKTAATRPTSVAMNATMISHQLRTSVGGSNSMPINKKISEFATKPRKSQVTPSAKTVRGLTPLVIP